MSLSLKQKFAELPKDVRDAWVMEQPAWLLKEVARNEWWWTSRPEQIPPEGDWLVHLALAGRGWGKSKAGSEWLVERCVMHPFDRTGTPTEWLVIAETLSDARLICLEGPAGILRVLQRRGIKYRYIKSPKPMVILEEGAKIYCEGADSEDVGRGYNASGSWLDEIAKWKKPRESWYNGIMPSLRADLYGDHPRCFVTTTPKPIDIIREWLKRHRDNDPTVSVVGGSTFDNAANLSQIVVAELKTRYEGTTIGRQELYGEMLDLLDNSLFSLMDIENNRVESCPDEVASIIVGVDPNLTGEEDEMGVIVVARTKDNHHYILADESTVSTGRAAALHCWNVVARFGADFMVYENNLGKAWMAQVMRDAYMELMGQGLFPAGTTPPMKSVDSKLGKKTRAEPVAMRYQQCLPAETLISTERGDVPIVDVRAGEKVWTRAGLQVVTWSGQTGIMPLLKITHEQGILHCTGNHRVFVAGRGFVPAELLAVNDSLVAWSGERNVSIATDLCTCDPLGVNRAPMDSGGQFGRSTSSSTGAAFTSLTAATSGLPVVASTPDNFFTGQSGNSIMDAQFRTDLTSITGTMPRPTTTSTTWSASPGRIIAGITDFIESPTPGKFGRRWRPQDGPGGTAKRSTINFARCVVHGSAPGGRERSSVQTGAYSASVLLAIEELSTPVSVYDLSVDFLPEFFADGVLVHNSKVHHVGRFDELEKQLVGYDFTSSKDSPDRLDALVHACRHLMAAEKKVMKLATPMGQELYVPQSFDGSYYG